jgi:hypothetical protein
MAEILAKFEEPSGEWYIDRRKQVQQEPDKWPDWRVWLYHLKLHQVEKVIDGTTDRWKLQGKDI